MECTVKVEKGGDELDSLIELQLHLQCLPV